MRDASLRRNLGVSDRCVVIREHSSQPIDCEFSQIAFKRRQATPIENHNVFFISLEDLILQKLLWRKETQSEQQLNDIKRLIAQNETILNREHLNTWSRELGLQEEMARLL